MQFADYGQIKAVNWSTLKEIARSPRHYRHAMATSRPDTDIFRLGRALHTLVLQPERWEEEYAVWPAVSPTTGKKTRRAGSEWDRFEAEAGDRTILREQDIGEIRAMARAVRSDPVCRRWLTGMRHVEQTLRWTDCETGIECKGRCDLVSASGILADLKTDRDGSPFSMGRKAASLGYHAQLAFYVDGAAAMGLDVDPSEAALIVVEKPAPHDCGVLLVTPEDIDAGRAHYRALLARLAECLEYDEWPGMYAGQVQTMKLPPWAPGVEDETDFEIEEF